MILVAQTAVLIGLGYLLIGWLFGIAFVIRGVDRVDPVAQGAGIGFRLIILPGVAALWPLLLMRWTKRGGQGQ